MFVLQICIILAQQYYHESQHQEDLHEAILELIFVEQAMGELISKVNLHDALWSQEVNEKWVFMVKVQPLTKYFEFNNDNLSKNSWLFILDFIKQLVISNWFISNDVRMNAVIC